MKKDEQMSKDNLMASEVTKNRAHHSNLLQRKITPDFNESPCLNFSKTSTATSITHFFVLLSASNPKKMCVCSRVIQCIHSLLFNQHITHVSFHFVFFSSLSLPTTHHIIKFNAALLMLIPHVRLNVLHFLFISF